MHVYAYIHICTCTRICRCICMYAYAYMYTQLYSYTYTNSCKYMCMYVDMDICACAWTCTCICYVYVIVYYIFIYCFLYMRIHSFICMYKFRQTGICFMFICAYMYIRIHTCVCTYAYSQVHAHVYVYIEMYTNIHIYICTHTFICTRHSWAFRCACREPKGEPSAREDQGLAVPGFGQRELQISRAQSTQIWSRYGRLQNVGIWTGMLCAGFASFLGFGVEGQSYSNFLASTAGLFRVRAAYEGMLQGQYIQLHEEFLPWLGF